MSRDGLLELIAEFGRAKFAAGANVADDGAQRAADDAYAAAIAAVYDSVPA